jgi:protein CpxP
MKPTFRAAALCAAVAMTAAMSPAAWAQAEHRGPPRPPPELQARREAHERQRAQDLRTILRLRPDQEAALSALLQSQGPPMPPPEGRDPPTEAMTTPQRLDAMARREAEHAQVRQRRTDALRAFYAALSPDQRQAFDALMRMQGGDEHGGRGGHGFGGPHGPREGPPGGPPRG